MAAEDEPPPVEMNNLIRYCEREGLELVISADCNGHHNLWGMETNNKRGTGLAAQHVSNWHVSDEASCSDHRWIRYDLTADKHTIIPKRNPRRTDITAYKKLLEGKLDDNTHILRPNNTKELEDQVNLLTKHITDSYENTCPLSTPSAAGKNKDTNSWWGPELEQMRTKMRRLFNRAMNTKAEEDWDRYQTAKSDYKKRLRYKKSASWRNFCDNIANISQANRTRKVLADQPRQLLGTLKRQDNTDTGSPAETERLLVETHFPGCKVVNETDSEQTNNYNPTESEWKTAELITEPNKTHWAVNSFENFKAPGTDGIYPALLKWGGHKVIKHLSNILCSCIALRYIPQKWREVKVIFLPKPGKTDYTDPKSFRPISLTSFMLKTLERLCDKELKETALKNIQIHPNQHAYSQGKSTDSALHAVVSNIENALTMKNSCLGTFIDIEGAFDKTNFSSIQQALQRHETNPLLIEWIMNMLRQRRIKLSENQDHQALVMRGCPQGGVLSPLLWNLVVNDLITKLNEKHFITIGYADDLVILISGLVISTLCNLTQTALKIVEKWCTENDLSVNPKKTDTILFTHKRKLGIYEMPTLFGTRLTLSKEVKYLGIILDDKLNWSKHLEQKLSKATVAFWQCRRMVGKKWGLAPHIILWLYKMVIMPMISYGAIVWWPRTKQTTAIDKLNKTQRLACVATTGCMRTTPTAALEIMLGLLPLHIYIQKEAAATALRLKDLTLWTKLNATHKIIYSDMISKMPMLEAPVDKIPKTTIFCKKYTTLLTEDPKEGLYQTNLRIFTDGSKTKEGTGCGVFSEDLNIHISKPLGEHSTVFQAECVGIIEACNAIKRRQVKHGNIMILSDSKSVLQALDSPKLTSKLILECHQRLTEVCEEDNKVTIQWIKGHSGSRGNDAADELAREGSAIPAYGPEPIITLPVSYRKNQLSKHYKQLHNKYWVELDTCRQTKEILAEPNTKLTKILLRTPRQQLRKLVGLMTGHNTLNKHLNNIGITDSPMCRACLEAEKPPNTFF
ncbi:uncharacterized protein LOC125240570 isoform X2 [Leguminivora glycinivorella]|nr:uncharacterized protein LOC125240570 isoform X2 [Leguminivora glycinivorella]